VQGNQPSELAYSQCHEEICIFDPNHVACFPLDCKDTVPTTHILACKLVL